MTITGGNNRTKKKERKKEKKKEERQLAVLAARDVTSDNTMRKKSELMKGKKSLERVKCCGNEFNFLICPTFYLVVLLLSKGYRSTLCKKRAGNLACIAPCMLHIR